MRHIVVEEREIEKSTLLCLKLNGTMAYSGGGGGGGGSCENTAREMTKAVVEIVNSCHFDREQILGEKLRLSQAYCLLWQNSDKADVEGRKYSVETNGGAVAAVLIDLVALGKIDIQVVKDSNTTHGIKNDMILLKVLDDTPTGTYLDAAMLNKILEHHSKKPDKPDKVKSWIVHGVNQFHAKNRCSTITLDSLVDLGILDMKETLVGRKYPTVIPDMEEKLKTQIRAVALDRAEPSSYIRALLTLARLSDNLLCLTDPVLEKHFSKEEFGKAKERINELVGIGKKNEQKHEQTTFIF